MTANKTAGKKSSRLKNKFVIFSAIVFLVILVIGSLVYVSSMRQIIRTSKVVELTQMLDIERIWIEGMLNADVSMVLKMASSPLIGRHFSDPEDERLQEEAIKEMDSFRRFFSEGYEIFWINDSDRIFHIDGSDPYEMNVDAPENYWYNMTLYGDEEYNFNINYNPSLGAFKLWINAPVFNESHYPVGMLGAGIDLVMFTERINNSFQNRGLMYYFNSLGEITNALDLEPVKNKEHINDELYITGLNILELAKSLEHGETGHFQTQRGEVVIGTIPLLGWYTVAYSPDSISDYDTVMSTFFIIVLVLMLAIFIIFNLFIDRYLRSLSRTMESLEIASKAKSTFLANMSHEIRTPMNAIMGVTDIMMQSESLSEAMAEGLNKISGSCDLLLGIINDLLDFSKIETGKLDVVPVQYHLAGFINSSVHLNMLRIKDKPIEFALEIDENVPAKLIGDELRVKQLLNNLLSNAFKYTEEGKVTLYVTFEPHTDKNKGILVLTVEDTGCGMTNEQLEELFEEYARFTKDHMHTVEGTGLGLTITQRLLTLMDGDIRINSEPGVGTTASVRLPQELVDEEVLGKEISDNLRQFYISYLKKKRQARIEYDSMPYGNVLIVDDVETNLYVAEGLMKLYNLQVETTMHGYEAIEKVKAGNVYDIIFMDHMMPGMDGIEITNRIRDLGYTGPIVALTANAVLGQADIFLECGFDDYISKPIDLRRLNTCLLKFIKDKKPPEVIEAHQSTVDPLLIDSFIRDASKSANLLDKLLTDPDFNDLDNMRLFIITIHGMKSSLGNIGETKLSEAAARLEDLGRSGNHELIVKDAPLFLDDLHALLEKMQPSHKNILEGDDPDDLSDRLLELMEMCVQYNRKGALSIIADIKTCSAKTGTILEQIKEHVLSSDYDEAEAIATRYANEINK